MHVHARHPGDVRTTVEISDRQRARLLDLAARRGEKGFSRIVEEALDRYFREVDGAARKERADRAVAALGTLGAKAAAALRASREETRKRWR
jgi:hypothetical protein